MPGRTLKKKPLVEAIFELRWSFQGKSSPASGLFGAADPNYRLLVGRFSERVRAEYPAYQSLPTAQIPDGMAPQVPQHQFRKLADGWPLLQLGPGILTANETEGYDWALFLRQCTDGVQHFYDSHPSPKDIRVDQIVLRFLDAFEFDPSKDRLLDFLRDKLKIGISLPDSLFTTHDVSSEPTAFVTQMSFKCSRPSAIGSIQLGFGEMDKQPAIILTTVIESSGNNVPGLPQDFATWANQAHDVMSDWFFDLIEGELYASFDPV